MKNKLSYREDGTFKLLQLTDIHFTDDNEADHRTVSLMREIIQAEKPDFIMITGDTVYGEKNTEYLLPAMAPVTESGIPWGLVFGNHDSEALGNRRELFDEVLKLPGCMAYHDQTSGEGIGNFSIELCGRDGRPEWVFFGMDSGEYSTLKGIEGYAYMKRPQIDWYCRNIKEYEKKSPDFSSMLFMHIALPEHAEVWDYEICYGVKREVPCGPQVNSGFFLSMLETGHTKGVFVGHDHVNDYWGWLHGIALGYGRCTGFNTYGAQDFPKGARVFCFREGNTRDFETYVRLEHGIKVDDPWVQHPVYRRFPESE